MPVINTNVKALVASNAMNVNSRNMSQTMQSLSTGSRINSAADDAAGLAIASKMSAQIGGLDQAVRNANDGISMLQVAEGATAEQSNMLLRMRDLAVQAANDTNSTSDRSALNAEYQQLAAEVDRIGASTQFNGMSVLNQGLGSLNTSTSLAVVTLQIGATGTDTLVINMKKFDTATGNVFAAIGTATSPTDHKYTGIDTLANATAAIGNLDTAISTLNTERAAFGAYINRLTHIVDNLANVSQNTSEARSRIQDTDFAKATTALSKQQIIAQASTAMLAQANQQPQTVLALLK